MGALLPPYRAINRPLTYFRTALIESFPAIVNAIGALLLCSLIAIVLSLSRRAALLATFGGVLYLTQAQNVDVGGFNLFAIRILELVAFARVMLRREFSFQSLGAVDKAVLAFAVYTTVVYGMRTRDGLTYRIGWACDVLLSYFAFRGLVNNREDVRWFLKSLVWLLIPYALIVVYDSLARNNLFALVGGRIGGSDMMREGRLRACGSFRHPSLMGTLGGSFLPLYIGLAFDRESRFRALLGFVACLAIVWASNSGGPLSCVMVGIVGWMFWSIRHRMVAVRRCLLVAVVVLALAMKAPIWYLIARLSSITGGDGFHRSHLMDQAFTHLGQWWLAGMPIEGTMYWFPYYIHSTGGADITNQFLSFGIAAGLGSMFLFFCVIVRAFKAVGAALDSMRAAGLPPVRDEYLIWATGVVLAVHIFNWLGINYFDQSYAVWYAQLATIAACGTSVDAREHARLDHSHFPLVENTVSCTTS